jgi:multidrug resistance efflux pump
VSWILAGIYCGILWLVFAKLRLLKLTLPIAIAAASVGPGLILALLFCAQYFHPFATEARVFQKVVPIIPQLRQAGRVTEIPVKPNEMVKQGAVLFKVDPIPYQNSVARLAAAVTESNQARLVAEASIELAQATLTRATADLDFATQVRDRNAKLVEKNAISQQDFDASVNRYAEATAAVTVANATLTQSRLSVELAKTRIEQVETQLADAQYDLEQTTIYAPGDGFVTNLQLRPGMLVGGTATGAIMSFVLNHNDDTRGIVVATFSQKNYLRINPGQYAEVALNTYPGEIFTGRVVNAIDISGAGQLTASGEIPTDLGGNPPTQFAVRIKLDQGDQLRLPGGSQALAAVYTEDMQIAGIPVMFLIRAQSWLRYLQ